MWALVKIRIISSYMMVNGAGHSIFVCYKLFAQSLSVKNGVILVIQLGES